ncbi:MAG TPA: aspartate--tRNA ligase, partial [Euryarchaeota archaeon]|nr:aspartate--tRNA ligase [Euryarchaeota archaeon]
VIQVEGIVRKRPKGTEDDSYPTGSIEVVAQDIRILSESETPPFELVEEKKSFLPSEDVRLKWRFLDLRRRDMIKNLSLKNEISRIVRNFLWRHGFWEIETPYLVRSTPEGARDFIVPVRAIPGTFYALPQSPQLYKQLLMVSGMDRYFQFARCFRDEDLRESRQPEFTQIDIEMSFVDKEDIISLVELMIKELWSKLLGVRNIEFKRLKYDEAIKKYGTDKPDLRYGMEIRDVTHIVEKGEYKVFRKAIEQGARIKAIRTEGIADRFTSKDAQRLIDYVINVLKGKGLTWIIVKDNDLVSIPQTIAESFPREVRVELIQYLDARDGDILFLVADKELKALSILGEVRRRLAEMLNLYRQDWSFVWILEPPYFKRDLDGNVLRSPTHHPFTSPLEVSIEYLQQPLEKIYANAYDLVINGEEIGGGSIRIHDPEIQRKILELLGYTEKEAEQRFGFLINAFRYGAPPHGGLAIGLDRLAMIMARERSIREVIAFPKTKNFYSPVDGAPTPVDEAKLNELGIVVIKRREGENGD